MKKNMKLYPGLLAVLLFFVVGCGGNDNPRGEAFFKNGQYREAVIAFEEELRLDPTNTSALYNLARSYEELDSYDKSYELYHRLIKIDEQNTAAHLSLAQLYYKQENYERAGIYARKAIKINEKQPYAHLIAARSSHQLGNRESALKFYNSALDLNKDFGEAYLYRGALLVADNKQAKGCRDFEVAQRLGVKEADNALLEYCN